jgi:phage head maturation protease
MTRTSGPRGWSPGQTSTRFADTKPSSFNAKTRSVDAVLSMGSPVKRIFGIEKLLISPDAVDLSRMQNGSMIPLLDSHQSGSIGNALGRVTKTWFNRGALWGSLVFNKTPNGQTAMGMVQRGEIAGISCGYAVDAWRVIDEAGRTIDSEVERIRWDEDDLIFEVTRWSIHEISLVNCPADILSGVRSMTSSGLDRVFVGTINRANDALVRMQVRQRMRERQTAYDDRRAVTGVSDRPAASAWRRASSVFP